MKFNVDTTWIGLAGGGLSGSVVGGGSIYQFDLWNMGGQPLPARVMVKGVRAGAMAEMSASHAMLLVTGCSTAGQMDGITSSGLDWEISIGLKGSNLMKSGGKIFSELTELAAKETIKWATNEPAKRMVQWVMDDLGIVKPGRQFNLLPSPVAFGVGGGLFYEWQKLSLLKGNAGWSHITPTWNIKSDNGCRLTISNIPEQNGTEIVFGLAVDKLGYDPIIRWSRGHNGAAIDYRHDFRIVGYVYNGELYKHRSSRGEPGINLSDLIPIGEYQKKTFSVEQNRHIERGRKIKIRPMVFNHVNHPYWEADTYVEVTLGPDGRLI